MCVPKGHTCEERMCPEGTHTRYIFDTIYAREAVKLFTDEYFCLYIADGPRDL